MSDDTEAPIKFTFAHFVDSETLTARTRELGGRYSEEQVAATAFFLGTLSLASFQTIVPIYGDEHYVMHLLANVFAGDWLVTLVSDARLDPEHIYDFALKNWGERLGITTPHGMEDIKAPIDDGLPPMDSDTFSRLWGPHS